MVQVLLCYVAVGSFVIISHFLALKNIFFPPASVYLDLSLGKWGLSSNSFWNLSFSSIGDFLLDSKSESGVDGYAKPDVCKKLE